MLNSSIVVIVHEDENCHGKSSGKRTKQLFFAIFQIVSLGRDGKTLPKRAPIQA